MEKKETEEITSKPLIPLVIEIKSLIDMMEACPNGVIFHKEKDSKHYYYFYISLGETLMILMMHKSDKGYKRYLGNLKGKVLDASEPNSDCFTPTIEVNYDPILEMSLMIENEIKVMDTVESNKEMPKV